MTKKAPRAAFSYYGGKQRIASKIVPLLPPHSTYVEPFAGGAAVMFAKGRPPGANASDYREVLNDVNGRIVNFYRVLQDHPDELIHRIENTPYARAEYERAKEWADRDGVDGAWSWLVQISMAYARSANGTGWNVSAYANEAGRWKNKMLREIAERVRDAHIEQGGALDVIKRWDSPETLFYCDPPYPDTAQEHYSGYSQRDFQDLVAALDVCEGSAVLSCYPQPGVPDHWERVEIEASCATVGAVGGDHERTEVVWRVNRSAAAPRELRAKWASWQNKDKVRARVMKKLRQGARR